jgi:hypothetical protein
MTVEPAAPRLAHAVQPKLLTLRLSIMMFLQWGMFGLWAPLAGMFLLSKVQEGGLGFTQYQVGWILGISGSIGALAAPFIAGQIADRYFSTERLMAVILVIGGVLWWIMSGQTAFGAWLALSISGSLALAPTGALSNSLAFAHMSDPTRQFPVVRVWGTIGWIVAMWIFAWVWLRETFVVTGGFPFLALHGSVELTWKPMFLMGQERPDAVARAVQSLKAGAIVGFVYAAYCLTLPNTPPRRDAAEKLAFWKAFRLFRHRSFLVLAIAALMIACIHNIFFMQTSNHLKLLGMAKADVGPAMTIGQITEIVMIAILGWMLKRLGMRAVLTIGGAAYLLRFLFLGSTWLPLWAIVLSLGFHGICFACYYAAAFIYVDRLADEDIRHTTQTLFGILIGIGPVIGGYLNGVLAGAFTPPGGGLNYTKYWYTVAAIGAVAALVLGLLFRDETRKARPPEAAPVS